jgi:multidrug efflux system membrane fusion protein
MKENMTTYSVTDGNGEIEIEAESAQAACWEWVDTGDWGSFWLARLKRTAQLVNIHKPNMKMSLRFNFSGLAGAIRLAGPLLLAVGCQKSSVPAAPPPAPEVTANQPARRNSVEWDQDQGRMEPTESVEIRSRVTGYLQSINFKDGAEVKKGDLLFVIDSRPYQSELDRVQANLQQAVTRFELTSNEWVRAQRLLRSKAISEEEADSRSKAVRESQGAIESDRAAVEMARINLDYTRITAPISGRISRRQITEGNLVNGTMAQATLLTTIVSLDPIYCYFDADEASILNYQKLARQGKSDNLRGGKVPCEVELANETGFPHKGLLDFVENQVDPSTGTLRVRGVFANPDRILQPGFFARARVPATAEYAAMLIPDSAVGADQDQKFVYVVNAQDAVEYRIVKLGPMIDGLRVVREGLGSNDWVVVNGLMTVRPGAKVSAKRAALASTPEQPVAELSAP